MKRFFREWKLILVGLIALGAFFARLYNLTILPVFVDEAIYIRWSQVMQAEATLRFLPLSDGKQPLFMWIMIPFLKIFSDPLFAGRFISVLSGFGTMIGVGFLSWLLFRSKKAALAAGIIYAVSPFTFFFDRLALADSLLSMFGIWTFIFSYLAVTKLRLDFAMLAGFALGGAWLTKSPALFFVLMLPTLWMFGNCPKGFKKNLVYLTKLTLLTLVTLTISYAMYNILRLGPNFNLIASRNLDYVWPLSRLLTSPLDPFRPFLDRSFEWIRMMGPWALIPLWIAGYFVNLKKNWKTLLVLTIWFLVPILVQSEFAKVLTARYILFSIPYLIILAGSVFIGERKYLTPALAVVLGLFVAQAVVFDYRLLVSPEKANLPNSERSGYLEEWTAGTGIKEIAGFLKSEQAKNPKEKIVVGTEGYFGTLPDGLKMYLADTPSITVIGTGLDFNQVPQSLLESLKFGNKTYLVVNSSRLKIQSEDFAKNGLKVITSYKKSDRREKDTHEYIWYGLYDTMYLFEIINNGKN